MSEWPLAVVTGASSGIGATFARKLAQRGHDLLLVARREERLRALANELADAYKIDAEAFPADLTCGEDLERVAARIESAPRLALLVNNAGFGTLGYFFKLDVQAQMQMHRLHVLATVRLTHAALQNMVAKNAGGVINVSSVAGFMIGLQSVSYSATKAWMNNFTQGVALELAATKTAVKIQALCPGFTLSEFHDTLGMDRSGVPKAWWMTADFVVDESLRGLESGKLFVIPGWRYKVLAALLRHLPDAILRQMALIAGGRRRRKK